MVQVANLGFGYFFATVLLLKYGIIFIPVGFDTFEVRYVLSKKCIRKIGVAVKLEFLLWGFRRRGFCRRLCFWKFSFFTFRWGVSKKAQSVTSGTFEKPQAPDFKPRGNRENWNTSMGLLSLKFKDKAAPEKNVWFHCWVLSREKPGVGIAWKLLLGPQIVFFLKNTPPWRKWLVKDGTSVLPCHNHVVGSLKQSTKREKICVKNPKPSYIRLPVTLLEPALRVVPMLGSQKEILDFSK